MRWIVTIAVLVWLVLGAVRLSLAIDAKPKSGATTTTAPADTGSAKRTATTKKASNQTLLEKLKKDVRESKKSSASQYDNYIDRNNDGVDDRVKEKPKVKSAEATPKKPSATPAAKQSTTKKKKPR